MRPNPESKEGDTSHLGGVARSGPGSMSTTRGKRATAMGIRGSNCWKFSVHLGGLTRQEVSPFPKKENKQNSVNRRWHRSMPSVKSTAIIRRPTTRVVTRGRNLVTEAVSFRKYSPSLNKCEPESKYCLPSLSSFPPCTPPSLEPVPPPPLLFKSLPVPCRWGILGSPAPPLAVGTQRPLFTRVKYLWNVPLRYL